MLIVFCLSHFHISGTLHDSQQPKAIVKEALSQLDTETVASQFGVVILQR